MTDSAIYESLNLAPSFLEAIIYVSQSLSIFAVFYSTRRLGLRINSLATFAIFAFGCLIPLTLAVRGYNDTGGFQSTPNAVFELTETPLVELPMDPEKTVSTENRESTRILARNAYINHAKIIDYVASNGSRERFSPDTNDIQARDKISALHADLELLALLASKFRYRSAIFFLTAALMGYFSGLIARKQYIDRR